MKFGIGQSTARVEDRRLLMGVGPLPKGVGQLPIGSLAGNRPATGSTANLLRSNDYYISPKYFTSYAYYACGILHICLLTMLLTLLITMLIRLIIRL